MLGVIFHWDHKVGLEAGGRRNLFQRYDYTRRAFCPDKVAVVDVDGTITEPLVDIVHTRTIGDALALFGGAEPVYVTKAGSVALPAFDHPAEAVYIFGPDYGGLEVPSGAQSVRVEYPDAGMVLWATVAMGIVLYDRSLQWP